MAGVDGVYAMTASRNVSTVIVLDQPDAYTLAVVTCALLHVMPDQDRRHIGVSAARRFHEVFGESRLTFDDATERFARARADGRPPPPKIDVDHLPEARMLALELVWMFGNDGLIPVEVIPDPFRSLDPAMPIIVTGKQPTRGRRHAWQAQTVAAALERLMWAKPKWIACDEDLALGDDGLLIGLENEHPTLLSRTMVVVTESSAEWMQRMIARNHPTVRVVLKRS